MPRMSEIENKETILRTMNGEDVGKVMKYLYGGSSKPDGIIRHIYSDPNHDYNPTKVIFANGEVLQQMPVPTQIPHIVSIKLYNTKATKLNVEKLDLLKGFFDGFNFTIDFEELYKFNSGINKNLPYDAMYIVRTADKKDIVWRILDVAGNKIEFHHTTEDEINMARGEDLTQGEDFKITKINNYKVPDEDLIKFSKSPTSSTWRFSANPKTGDFKMTNNLINDNFDTEYDSIVLNNELLRGVNVKTTKTTTNVSELRITTLNSEHSNRVLWSFKLVNDTFITQSFMVALDYTLYDG